MPKKISKDIHDQINKKLDKILNNQKLILKQEKNILDDENKILAGEKKQFLKEEDELKQIEELEREIMSSINKDSALKKITHKDVTKGMIGAFFGIVGHFAFAKGSSIAAEFSYLRSTAILVTSFAIITVFLYYAGFRKVNDKFLFKFLPVRAMTIYATALTTITFVLILYGVIDFNTSFQSYYNTLAAISVLAVLGAGTADLLGKVEE